MRLYRVCYVCVTETISNLEKLTVEQARKVHDMCSSFMKLTDETQKQVGAMLSQLKDSVPAVITYFKATPDLLNNLKEFIAAKEEVEKAQEEAKDLGMNYPLPPANNYQQEDEGEYNLDEPKKEEEGEYNLGNGGLEDFMTSLQQERKSEVPAASYKTNAEDAKAMPKPRQTTGAAPNPAKNRVIENDNEIMGFVQAKEAPQKGGVDDFESLFGNMGPTAPAYAPPRPEPSQPAAKKQATAYDEFNNYFTTYQQPPPRPSPAPAPTSQYYQPAPAAQYNPSPPRGPNPFDNAESQYSRPNPVNQSPSGSW